MSDLQTVQQVAVARRSIYNLTNQLPISNEEVAKVVEHVITHTPSSFNSQTSRVVTLYGESHHKFWEIVRETLRKMVPAEAFANTSAKIDSFSAGFGTALFYEDQDVVKGLQEQFALYADNFPVWSEHSSAIAQFATWTALSEIGVGASLQHYNPIVDAEVAETFDIPSNWKLRAQLVFGSIEAAAGEKTYMDDAARFKTFN